MRATDSMKTGIELIADERARQVSKEGWTADHDDYQHAGGDLTEAAMCYAEAATVQMAGLPMSAVKDTPDSWPWDYRSWKPSDNPERNLVKAAALLAAEIDRMRRAQEAKP